MSLFKSYLINNFNSEKRATTDYALRVEQIEDGCVKFYIHPQGDQSKILYLEVNDDVVSSWIKSKMPA